MKIILFLFFLIFSLSFIPYSTQISPEIELIFQDQNQIPLLGVKVRRYWHGHFPEMQGHDLETSNNSGAVHFRKIFYTKGAFVRTAKFIIGIFDDFKSEREISTYVIIEFNGQVTPKSFYGKEFVREAILLER